MVNRVSHGWYLTKDFKNPAVIRYTRGNDIELEFLASLKRSFLERCNEEGYREAVQVIESIIEKLR